MEIRVTPEGREGIWIPNRNDLIEFIDSLEFNEIHNYNNPTCGLMIGADWSKNAVIETVAGADRLAILTGEARKGNMNHALSVIQNNELSIFDIGSVMDYLIVDDHAGKTLNNVQ